MLSFSSSILLRTILQRLRSIKMAKEAKERVEKQRLEEEERLRKAQEEKDRLTKLRAERRNALLETLPAEPGV